MLLHRITPTLSPADNISRIGFFFPRGGEILFLGLCVLAALRPFLISERDLQSHEGHAKGFPGWESIAELADLKPLKLRARDAQFAAQFPGEVAAFARGRNIWVARWVAKPTRKLHPAADCLRATGYAVRPEPIFADARRAHWGTISASRGNEKLLVHERIVDRDGREFTDVSAWYWSAIFEKSAGPWWCLTKIESDPAP